MPTLIELQKQRDTKSAELSAIWDKAKTDEKDASGQPVLDLAKAGIAFDEIKKRNDELSELGKAVDAAKEIDEAYKAHQAEVKAMARATNKFNAGNGGGNDNSQHDAQMLATKTLQRGFTESPAYKSWLENKQGTSIKLEGSIKQMLNGSDADGLKTTLTTTAGYLPPTLMDTRVILSAQRRPVVADLIPQDDTMQQFIPYIQETTFTNSAAAVAEGAVKPESALQFTRVVAHMQKVATTLPVTQEQMMFVPQIEALLKNRLGLMVQLEQEREILNGSGTGPEVAGFLNTAGVLTQAQAGDDVFTAVYKAITKVRSTVGFADPSGLVIHPNNWLTMRTLKDTTGRFILGNPDEVGPERIWSLPVIPTIAEPAGTALIGDFRTYSHIDNAMGLTIQVGYINNDFTLNIVRLLAELYFAMEVYRPSAFATITGLA
jgi:HK97 family phage major capsid protein